MTIDCLLVDGWFPYRRSFSPFESLVLTSSWPMLIIFSRQSSAIASFRTTFDSKYCNNGHQNSGKIKSHPNDGWLQVLVGRKYLFLIGPELKGFAGRIQKVNEFLDVRLVGYWTNK